MYLRFFGLETQPFGVTPDPRFLYMSPAHEEAFASLVYGIETGRGFVALIAGPGLGKTTVLMRLMERLQESARTAFLFQTHLQSEEFLKSLITDLGVEPQTQNFSDLQRQFTEVLIQESRRGKRVVVAIDEAQNLDNSTLEMVRMLSNFETAQAKLLQIVLVGQKELADKLARPELEQLRQRVSIITHFPPFPPDEVGRYIDHRLRVAGYKGGQLFTPAALRIIAAQSGGVPRNINNLCFHALSLAFAKNQKVVTDLVLQEVLKDLNLHLLGTKRAVAAPVVPAEALPKADKPASGADSTPGTRTVVAPETPTPRHAAPTAESPLDAVSLSSHLTGPEVDFRPEQRASARRIIPPQRAARTSPGLFRLALLAAVLVAGYWARPWLEEGFYVWVAPFLHGAATVPEEPPRESADRAIAPAPAPQIASSGNEAGAPGTVLPPSPVKAAALPNAPPAERRGGSYAEPVDHLHSAAPVTKATPGKAKRWDLARQNSNVDDLGAHGPQRFLVVESSESGAHISINGQSSQEWVTPHLFSLVAGVYNIKIIKAGFKPWTQQVRVDGSPEKWLVASLEAYGEGGILTVETDPPGMQVFVDGKPYGKSRVETELPAGWHVCEVVTGPGVPPLVSRFHLDPGEALTRRIRVTPLAATPTGEVRPQPSEWNQTRVN